MRVRVYTHGSRRARRREARYALARYGIDARKVPDRMKPGRQGGIRVGQHPMTRRSASTAASPSVAAASAQSPSSSDQHSPATASPAASSSASKRQRIEELLADCDREEQLQGQLDELTGEHAILSVEHACLRKKHASLRRKHASLAAEHASLREKDSSLREKHSSLRERHSSLRERHSRRRERHSRRREKHSSLREEHASLGAEHANLGAEHASLSEKHETAQLALLSPLPRYSRYFQTSRVALDPADPTFECLEQHFVSSVLAHRPGPGQNHCSPPKLGVARIERICNPRLQEKYLAEVQDIAGLVERRTTPVSINAPCVESFQSLRVNEYLLYHGASVDIVERLTMQGLDPRYAGENAGKLFGSGCYFAANSSKSDIYTTPNAEGERCILITRVCLGEASIATRPCREATRPPEREDGRGPLNSIVAATMSEGGCVESPEFIVFKEAQALPEYAVWYRHEAGCHCTHCYTSVPMQITIKTLTDKRFIISIRPTDLVEQLKAAIQDTEGIPPDQQRLIFANTLMADGHSLASYGVRNGDNVLLVLRLRGG